MLLHLLHANQRGGQYLRVKAVRKIYESIDVEVSEHYSRQIKVSTSLVTHFYNYYYGKSVGALFRNASVIIPENTILHLEQLSQLRQSFNPKIKRPIVYNAHNLEFEFENYDGRILDNKPKRFIEFELSQLNLASLIFVCSQRQLDILNELYPIVAEKCFVLPNLVDKNDYHIAKEKNSFLLQVLSIIILISKLLNECVILYFQYCQKK